MVSRVFTTEDSVEDSVATFTYEEHSASINIVTSGSWYDYDLHVSSTIAKKLEDGTYDPEFIVVNVTKKTIGKDNSVETVIDLNAEQLSVNCSDGSFNDVYDRVEGGFIMTIVGDYPYIELLKNGVLQDKIDIVRYKDGVDGIAGTKGDKGERGPIIYPAGVWNNETTYEIIDNSAPYVEYIDDENNKSYYVLIAKSSEGDTPIDHTDIWQPMETFSSVFTDLIVADHGNIGGAVYCSYKLSNGDIHEFLYSKEGDGGDGYKDFLSCDAGVNFENLSLEDISEKSWFKPNILLNFKTGEAWFGRGTSKFTVDGPQTLFGSMKVVDIPLQTPRFMKFSNNESGCSSYLQYEYIEDVICGENLDTRAILNNGWAENGDVIAIYKYHSIEIQEDAGENGCRVTDPPTVPFDILAASNDNINLKASFTYTIKPNGDDLEFDNELSADNVTIVDGIVDQATGEWVNCYARTLYVNVSALDRKYQNGDKITLDSVLTDQTSTTPLVFSMMDLYYIDEADETNEHIGTILFYPHNMDLSEEKRDDVVDSNYNVILRGRSQFTFDVGIHSSGLISSDVGCVTISDETLKTFYEDIEVDFNKLAKLRKSYFAFNKTPRTKDIGVSAQEVKAIYPELVVRRPDGKLAVDYSKLSVVSLKAIDILNERLVALENIVQNYIQEK